MTAATFAQELDGLGTDQEALKSELKPIVNLVRELIGVVPNAYGTMSIWPTGLRSYNLLVPNLLNLPASVFGQGAQKDLIGLAMYAASRAADCMYCSAHSCSFALRRGANPDAILGHLDQAEGAVVTVSEAISRVPTDLKADDVAELRSYLSDADVEWLVLSVAMMGFLNKFMDTMGVELEDGAINDVEDLISSTGWSVGKHGWSSEDFDDVQMTEGRTLRPKNEASNGDSGKAGWEEVPVDGLGTYVRMIRNGPGAKRIERGWTKGVPNRISSVLMMLEDEVGYSFPVLSNLRHAKAVKAIGTVLRDNLDPDLTELGLGAKCLVGLVYARVVGNDKLAGEAQVLANIYAPHLTPHTLAAVSRFAAGEAEYADVPAGLSAVEAAAVMLAKTGSPSPSTVTEITIDSATSMLAPAQIVEVIIWLSIQQMMHRMYSFYDVATTDDES